MALHRKSVSIVTDGSGAFSTTVRGVVILRRIDLELGTLSTPDIDITDEPSGVVILSVNGVAADSQWYPTILGTGDDGNAVTGAALAFPAMGRMQIEVTGGGNTMTGRLDFLYET